MFEKTLEKLPKPEQTQNQSMLIANLIQTKCIAERIRSTSTIVTSSYYYSSCIWFGSTYPCKIFTFKFNRSYRVCVFIVSDQLLFLSYIQSFSKCSCKAPCVSKMYLVFLGRLEKNYWDKFWKNNVSASLVVKVFTSSWFAKLFMVHIIFCSISI